MNYLNTSGFELSRVFIGMADGRKHFLYSMEQGEKYGVIPESYVFDNSFCRKSQYADKVYIYDKSEVEIICSLQQLAEKEGLEHLLLDVQHNYVTKVKRMQIQLIKDTIVNKKSIFASSLPKLKDLANFTASIICDELGLNVAVHPMTTFIDHSKIQNVAISASKVAKFKEELSKYIYTLFLSQKQEPIFQDDKERSSCLTSCLRYSHIELTDNLLQNIVSVQPDLKTGTVKVRGEVLKPEFAPQSAEFQKVHILSVK